MEDCRKVSLLEDNNLPNKWNHYKGCDGHKPDKLQMSSTTPADKYAILCILPRIKYLTKSLYKSLVASVYASSSSYTKLSTNRLTSYRESAIYIVVKTNFASTIAHAPKNC